ncbi:hypothetical protein [Microbacterium sp. Leaf179]|uniref:hypothetical protein n=1 Tax=Microbacterium sp. Leaf179 TaxID=1736288 RepID=UPI0006F3445F|nr:hypothetical protein [Microbacterium sp. Leaf179]KQR86336.1 hypothetical protein ASF96_08065 [Microbacterium sp. Leaf179]
MTVSKDPADVIDLSRPPIGEIAAAQLVLAAAKIGDLAERHYLELKGPGDLASKQNKQKVAKFILGAANRSPERAMEAFDGYGVMVIGVTKEGIVGVPPVEMLSLEQTIAPFLGAAGPKWDVVRVPVEGFTHQVLLVLVSPPKSGHPVFICRENGDGLHSGRIYYRADGETREANAGEMDQLLARAAASTASVDLRVEVTGEIAVLEVDAASTIEEFIPGMRARLLRALANAEESASARPLLGAEAAARLAAIRDSSEGLASVLGAYQPERRTENEYREEISLWEERFRAAWPLAVENLARMVLDINEVRVENIAKTFMRDLEVRLHLEGAVEVMEVGYPEGGELTWANLQLPAPPRIWGPTKRQFALDLTNTRAAAVAAIAGDIVPSDTTWTSGGSVDVDVSVGDLRPEHTYQSQDERAILVIRGDATETVHGSWTATAAGHDDVFTGRVVVPVAAAAVLTDEMRSFLRLGDDAK